MICSYTLFLLSLFIFNLLLLQQLLLDSPSLNLLQRQLEARLDEINAQNLDRKSSNLAEYQVEALREANESFADLKGYLDKFPAGLQWVLALGYINAWGKLHRAKETLIEVEPVEVMIRGALHDKLGIQLMMRTEVFGLLILLPHHRESSVTLQPTIVTDL